MGSRAVRLKALRHTRDCFACPARRRPQHAYQRLPFHVLSKGHGYHPISSRRSFIEILKTCC